MNNTLMWNNIKNNSLQAEQAINPIVKKKTGAYYTSLELTDLMMSELVSKLDFKDKKIYEYLFLEPCVGSGNFVFSYLKAVKNLIETQEEAKNLINNIYVADINKSSLGYYKKSLKLIALEYWGISIEEEYFKTHVGEGLVFDGTKECVSYISLQEAFGGQIFEKKFDIIATNPPYKNLKAEISHYKEKLDYNKDKEKYKQISKIVKKKFKYANSGILNLYKIFVEEILENYSNKHSFISLLIPSSILSDKTCEKLRTYILENNFLHSVKIMQENNRFVDAKQALCALLISKSKKTKTINIVKDFCNKPNEIIRVNTNSLLNNNNGNAIIAASPNDFAKLKVMQKFPTVKELDFIVNLRGELDLTLDKKYFDKTKNNIPLIRGKDIKLFHINDKNIEIHVVQDFIKKTKKGEFINHERIACQQIANIHKKRRIVFSYVPPNYVLGNSCNFISIMPNKYNLDIFTLLGLFNSECIDWLFRLTSTNNHISNYEIDSFPVPINSSLLKKISENAREYIKTKNENLIEKNNRLCTLAYNL